MYQAASLRSPVERLHPVLTLLPVGLMASVVLFDAGAVMSGFSAFGTVAHWDMAMGLMTGLTVLTILLVDLTTALSGTRAQRVLGVVASATAGMVIVFGVIWWARQDGGVLGGAPQLLLEIVALAIGATGVWHARGMPEQATTEPHELLGLGDL